ncbi:aromatic acid exporter family protein [Streptomyces sp. NPDC003038]|uniref:FUSC family protein n=1 Tax=unclassified Streptomyces TaxID=2593676 RepID=UPI0033BCCECA
MAVQEARAARGAVRAALREPGPERNQAIQALKAAAAAVLAWALAGWWWEAPMAMMAPWSAVLLVRATVYQSVRCAGQQFLAIAVGTVTAAGAATLTGNTLAAMMLALPLTALAGNHPRFGEYGLSASATAVFVLTYGTYSGADIGYRLLESMLGSLIGVAVNALVLPPTDMRQVEQSLEHMRRRTADLLSAISDGLGQVHEDRTAESWHAEARSLGSALTALRNARHHTGESHRMNPAVLVRGCDALPEQWWDEHWERLAEHVRALTGTLVHVSEKASPPLPCRAVTDLAEVLAASARLCEIEPVSPREPRPPGCPESDEVWRTAWDAHDRLTRHVAGTDCAGAATIGALSAHARQLLQELHHARGRACEPQAPARHGIRRRRRRSRRRKRRLTTAP